jgi:hypothetical protein
MKKLLVLVLLLLNLPVLADNKATVKFGPIQYVSTTGAVANDLAEDVIITLGGNKGTTSGTLAITLDSSEVAQLEKGLELGVASVGDDSEGDSSVSLTLLGTSIKIKGTSTTTTSYASNNDSTAEGKFKVVDYNPSTKVLKFTLSAKLNPYTLTTSKLGQAGENKIVEKAMAVSVKAEITLP